MHVAFGLIPILFGLLLWWCVLVVGKSRGQHVSKRFAFLIASVVTSGWLVLGTELLSRYTQLRFWPVLAWWAGPILIALGFLAGRGICFRAGQSATRHSWLAKALGALLVLLWSIALFMAVAYPANTSDVRSYHLPRIFFWWQQASVAHFPTSDLRQLFNPPLSEYAGLHLMILAQSDRLTNVPAWMAFVGMGLMASLAVKWLGGGKCAQISSALFVTTIPAAFMQASSGKNDLAMAYWTLAVLVLIIRVVQSARLTWSDAILIGATTGFALLTKGTSLVYGVPIALVAGMFFFRVIGWRRMLIATPVIVLIALAINAAAWQRNLELGKKLQARPLMSPPDIPGYANNAGNHYGNETHSINSLLSNLSRNLALHLVSPDKKLNQKIEQKIREFHARRQMDIDDPRTTWPQCRFEMIEGWNREDMAGAPVHLAMATFALLLTPIIFLSKKRSPLEKTIWLIPAATFVVFCFVLKWQPWHVRLHIPILALQAIPMALISRQVWIGAAGLICSLVGIAVLAPTIALNGERPLLFQNSFPAVAYRSADDFYYRDRQVAAMKTRDWLQQRDPRVLGIIVGHPLESYDFIRLAAFRPEFNCKIIHTRPWDFTMPTGRVEEMPDVVVTPEGYENFMLDTRREYRAVAHFPPFQIMVQPPQP